MPAKTRSQTERERAATHSGEATGTTQGPSATEITQKVVPTPSGARSKIVPTSRLATQKKVQKSKVKVTVKKAACVLKQNENILRTSEYEEAQANQSASKISILPPGIVKHEIPNAIPPESLIQLQPLGLETIDHETTVYHDALSATPPLIEPAMFEQSVYFDCAATVVNVDTSGGRATRIEEDEEEEAFVTVIDHEEIASEEKNASAPASSQSLNVHNATSSQSQYDMTHYAELEDYDERKKARKAKRIPSWAEAPGLIQELVKQTPRLMGILEEHDLGDKSIFPKPPTKPLFDKRGRLN